MDILPLLGLVVCSFPSFYLLVFRSIKPTNNFFSISLSYVRPGTRFDLACSQCGRTRKSDSMFQCNKIN